MIRNGYPKNVTAIRNSNISFSCPTYTDYGIQIQWHKNSNEVLKVTVPYKKKIRNSL